MISTRTKINDVRREGGNLRVNLTISSKTPSEAEAARRSRGGISPIVMGKVTTNPPSTSSEVNLTGKVQFFIVSELWRLRL
jgi:hypothetical protein